MNARLLAVFALVLSTTGCPDTKDLEACCECLATTPAAEGATDCFGNDASDGEPVTEKKCVAKGTKDLLLGDGEEEIAVARATCTETLCADACDAVVEQGVPFVAPPESAGTLTCTIDGTAFTSGFVTAFSMPDPADASVTLITIQGHESAETAAGDEKIKLTLGGMSGPGTYPMGRRTPFEVFNEGDALNEPGADAEPGTYVVTELSEDHIVGTFEATLHRFTPLGDYDITDGAFDVVLAPPPSP